MIYIYINERPHFVKAMRNEHTWNYAAVYFGPCNKIDSISRHASSFPHLFRAAVCANSLEWRDYDLINISQYIKFFLFGFYFVVIVDPRFNEGMMLHKMLLNY